MWGDPLDCKAHAGRCDKQWLVGEKPDRTGYYYTLPSCPAKAIWSSTFEIINSHLMTMALRYRNTSPRTLFGGHAKHWPLNWSAFIDDARTEMNAIAHAQAQREEKRR